MDQGPLYPVSAIKLLRMCVLATLFPVVTSGSWRREE